MTGPEHYREAERLLRQAEAATDNPTTVALAAIAQAHATLAATGAILMIQESWSPEPEALWSGRSGESS